MIRRSTNGEFEFRLAYPSAHEVFLVGDFGQSQQANVPMARSNSGEWVCRLHLREGVYQFKYWVDGQWCLDEDPGASQAAPFLTSSLVVTNCTNGCGTYMG